MQTKFFSFLKAYKSLFCQLELPTDTKMFSVSVLYSRSQIVVRSRVIHAPLD